MARKAAWGPRAREPAGAPAGPDRAKPAAEGAEPVVDPGMEAAALRRQQPPTAVEAEEPLALMAQQAGMAVGALMPLRVAMAAMAAQPGSALHHRSMRRELPALRRPWLPGPHRRTAAWAPWQVPRPQASSRLHPLVVADGRW